MIVPEGQVCIAAAFFSGSSFVPGSKEKNKAVDSIRKTSVSASAPSLETTRLVIRYPLSFFIG
jgi:hypothetical protein